MYAWYKRETRDGKLHLVFDEQTSLGGCNNGVIAHELKEIIQPSDSPPLGWIIPLAEKWNPEGYSFIIDIKPSTGEVFLCEVDKIFGFSFEGWTPVMLRLKRLYSDLGKDDLDKDDFPYPEEQEIETLYTMLYYYGSFKDGQIVGTWNPPHGTITALLFWAEAMTFFFEQVKTLDPEFLTAKIKVLSH